MLGRRPKNERIIGIELTFDVLPDPELLDSIVCGIYRNGAFRHECGRAKGSPEGLRFGFLPRLPLDRRLEACREVRALLSRLMAERDQPKPQLATF